MNCLTCEIVRAATYCFDHSPKAPPRCPDCDHLEDEHRTPGGECVHRFCSCDQSFELVKGAMLPNDKPDGWHTYHICGGVLRELTFLGRDGTVSEAVCPNCGEWYRGTVTPPGLPSSFPVGSPVQPVAEERTP